MILAGGKGTRLKARLNGRPKPLVDIDGEPLLGRQLAELRAHGFDKVTVLVNHEAEQVRDYCRASGPPDMSIDIVDDGEPRGTAGATLAALGQLGERFLVIYGDVLFKADLDRFWSTHIRSGADATLFVHPNDHPHDSDIVEVDDAGWIQAFHGYPHPAGKYLPNLVNAAMYVIESNALAAWRDFPTPSDFAKDLFPAMLRGGARLAAYNSSEYVKDIGTPERLDKAVGQLRSGLVERASLSHQQRAVFLDRDGTLNRPAGFINSPDQLDLFPGVAAAIRRLNKAEYRAILITNQPVLARGECTPEGLAQIHAKLETELGREGAFLDGIYFCPHHPDSGFPGEVEALKVRCGCRKPAIGLIEQAEAAFNIDRARSWFVGDSTADIAAATAAGIRSILVRTGEGGRDGKYLARPDYVVDDLAGAVEFILQQEQASPTRVGEAV